MKILCFSMNAVLMKQYMDPKSIRAQKIGFWIWSDLQTSGNIRDSVTTLSLA